MDAHWSAWIGKFPVQKKIADQSPLSSHQIIEDSSKFDATIDLHFLTQQEAIASLERFITFSVHRNRRKILIIHGKGIHSQEQRSILKPLVINYLEHSPYVQRTGQARARDGGSGATWAVLKHIPAS
ncbi:MAG: Smr/MutS family protein [Spirochaetia bacterium]